MRLSVLPLLLAGAGIVEYAAATPIRVVVVTSSPDISTNVSFGTARPMPARPIGTPMLNSEYHLGTGAEITPQPIGAGRHHHFCAQFKEKALALSNKFRATFGLPPIEPNAPKFHNLLPPSYDFFNGGEPVEIQPLPFIGTPPIFSVAPPTHDDQPVPGVIRVGHGHHPYDMHPHLMHPSFLHRLHRALMSLGPWEGRAVAFVLGCGIGVLLRMFWVMAIVMFRTIRGGRSTDEDDMDHVLVFEADAEDIIVPPPQYTDEKVALADPATEVQV